MVLFQLKSCLPRYFTNTLERNPRFLCYNGTNKILMNNQRSRVRIPHPAPRLRQFLTEFFGTLFSIKNVSVGITTEYFPSKE